MRITAILGVAVLISACSSKDAPPAADTTAAVPAAPAATSVAGMWKVNVMPAVGDTVLTSYVLDATDSTNWKFTFDGRTDVVTMRITGRSGDTLMTEAGPFESGVQSGKQVTVKSKTWMQDGQLIGLVDAHYAGTRADSIVKLRSVGTRQ